jgi:peptidoglycan biosynthesis protein MviN/MurJ (putative lipid II flippase)
MFIAALNIGLCFALAPEFGAVGIAVANCVSLTTQNALNQWALRGSIGTRFIDRSCWGCYALIAAATGVLAAFQWVIEPNIVVSMVVAAVASLVVLWGSQPALRLSETFPELQRVPFLGRLVR